MVFFTCNSCGQCVKKAHVEKHYLAECRNCEVLSCMDCGKDFAGDDYKHHTQCVSENEKYGGKDYKANAKPNKGELKQSQWIQNVKSAGSSQALNPKVKGLLERLADYNNIPRKKSKFERFIQNSVKVYDSRLIEQIWTIFSEAGTMQKNQPEQKAVEKPEPKEKTTQEIKPKKEKSSEERAGKKSDDGSKKKDKHHGDKDFEEDLKAIVEEAGLAKEQGDNKQKVKKETNIESVKKKNKHIRHFIIEETKDEKATGGDEVKKDDGCDAELSKEKKKKRDDKEKMRHKTSDKSKPVSEEDGQSDARTILKKKKKHKRHLSDQEPKDENVTVDELEDNKDNGNACDETSKKSKKKRKDKEKSENELVSNGVGHGDAGSVKKHKKKHKKHSEKHKSNDEITKPKAVEEIRDGLIHVKGEMRTKQGDGSGQSEDGLLVLKKAKHKKRKVVEENNVSSSDDFVVKKKKKKSKKIDIEV